VLFSAGAAIFVSSASSRSELFSGPRAACGSQHDANVTVLNNSSEYNSTPWFKKRSVFLFYKITM